MHDKKISLSEYINDNDKLLSALGIFSALSAFFTFNNKNLSIPIIIVLLLITLTLFFELIYKTPPLHNQTIRLYFFYLLIRILPFFIVFLCVYSLHPYFGNWPVLIVFVIFFNELITCPYRIIKKFNLFKTKKEDNFIMLLLILLYFVAGIFFGLFYFDKYEKIVSDKIDFVFNQINTVDH